MQINFYGEDYEQQKGYINEKLKDQAIILANEAKERTKYKGNKSRKLKSKSTFIPNGGQIGA